MKSVLLLEDDQISLALYRRVLGRQWNVVVAETPDQALQCCEVNSIDLFISDNLLRVTTSGVETLHRAHNISSELKLMLVSGTPPEGFAQDDFKLFEVLVSSGVFDYLEKPFKAEVFVERAKALMHSSHDAQALEQRLAVAAEYRRGHQKN